MSRSATADNIHCTRGVRSFYLSLSFRSFIWFPLVLSFRMDEKFAHLSHDIDRRRSIGVRSLWNTISGIFTYAFARATTENSPLAETNFFFVFIRLLFSYMVQRMRLQLVGRLSQSSVWWTRTNHDRFVTFFSHSVFCAVGWKTTL